MMALPSAAGQRPSHSPAPATATDMSLRPPIKRIKRTSFPDWEDGPSPKRTSMPPMPTQRSPSVSSTSAAAPGGFASSKIVQKAQKLWEEQQAAAIDNPVLMEDEASEYFTSGSASSDDESAKDFDRLSSDILDIDAGDGTGTPTGLDSGSLNHQEAQGTAKPDWNKRPPVMNSPVPLPPNLARVSYPARSSSASLRRSNTVPTTIASTETGGPARRQSTQYQSDQASVRRTETPEDDALYGYKHHHLTPNELEAKIRADAQRALQGKKSDKATHGTVKRSEWMRDTKGPNGEFFTTADGRPYSELNFPDGSSVGTATAPIPTGYKLHDDPDNPFICPVRSCRKIGPVVSFLTGHFSASHNRTTFNDNLDGTISPVGKYIRPNGMTSAGIIVSRGAPPPDAAPPAIPMRSAYSQRMNAKSSSAAQRLAWDSERRASSNFKKASILQSCTRRDQSPMEYLKMIFSPDQAIPTRADVEYLLKCPKKRDLPQIWLDYHAGKTHVVHHFAIALAYIVGDEVQDPEQKCTVNMGSTSRLSDTCIRLPPDLPDEARKLFCKTPTCVGCRYYAVLQRQNNTCKWAGRGDTPSDGDTDMVNSWKPTDVKPTRLSLEEGSTRREEPRRAVRSSTRNHQSGSGLTYSTKFSAGPVEAGENQLEMEDWEFAPGRLVKDKEPSENVAFSNSYLTSREPVTVSDDINFNVSVLSSGATVRFEVEETKLRTCSVASGKVKVKIGDTEFKIGPHGMFKVMPGESCVVENRLYVDAYIHCTTVDNYEVVG